MRSDAKAHDSWWVRAVEAYFADRNVEALVCVDRYLHEAPDHPRGHCLKLEVLTELGRHSDAEELVPTLERASRNRRVALALAEWHEAVHDLAGAETWLDKAVAIDRSATGPYLCKGEFLVRRGRMEEALDVFQRGTLTSGYPEDAKLHCALALRAKNELSEALFHAERAIAANGSDTFFQHVRKDLLHAQALRNATFVDEISDGAGNRRRKPLRNRRRARLRERDDEAERWARHAERAWECELFAAARGAVERAPITVDTEVLHAEILTDLDLYDAAIERLEPLSPTSEVVSARVRNYRERKLYALAERELRGYLAVEEDDWDALVDLADILQRDDRLDDGADVLRHLVELDGESPRAHFLLGELLADQGRLVEAVDELRRALSLQPTSQRAALAIRRAERAIALQTARSPEDVSGWRRRS